MVGTMVLLATIFHLWDPQSYPDAMFHILTGTFMLGVFFIATDYVTAPITAAGKIVFAVSCAVLIFVIRTWGSFPEGVGFAILLMNAATPLIDHYLRPRIYGRNRDGEPFDPGSNKNES
jgi:electron transport complex protein RnfD